MTPITPNGDAGRRPDRSVIVYSQRCREAYYDTPIVIGGIEASLRRIAQYDYWSDSVRRSVLIDSNADILLYGNAERALVEVAHQLAAGRTTDEMEYLRGTARIRAEVPQGWTEIDSTRIDWPSKIDDIPNPYDFHDKKTDSKPKAESLDGSNGSDGHGQAGDSNHSSTLAAQRGIRFRDRLYSPALFQ